MQLGWPSMLGRNEEKAQLSVLRCSLVQRKGMTFLTRQSCKAQTRKVHIASEILLDTCNTAITNVRKWLIFEEASEWLSKDILSSKMLSRGAFWGLACRMAFSGGARLGFVHPPGRCECVPPSTITKQPHVSCIIYKTWMGWIGFSFDHFQSIRLKWKEKSCTLTAWKVCHYLSLFHTIKYE